MHGNDWDSERKEIMDNVWNFVLGFFFLFYKMIFTFDFKAEKNN